MFGCLLGTLTRKNCWTDLDGSYTLNLNIGYFLSRKNQRYFGIADETVGHR